MSTIERDELDGLAKVEVRDVVCVSFYAAKAIVDDLKAKLAEVTRERDEANEQVEILNEVCNGIRDTFGYSRDDMVDLTTYVAQDYGQLKAERDQLREQLATVQAEAAAMRDKGDKLGWWINNAVNEKNACQEYKEAVCEFIDTLQGATAGRDLLDDMKRKDERIKELEARNDELQLDLENVDYDDHVSLQELTEWSLMKPLPRVKDQFELNSPISIVAATIEKYRDRWRRAKRKCRTAKAALVEHYRDKIDPAWFGDQPTPEPVWQYRWKPMYQILYRGNESGVFQKLPSGNWDRSGTYPEWQDCCDDPATYPCNESGERIEDHSADAGKMVDEPLKVGDWVECKDSPNDSHAGHLRFMGKWVNGPFLVVEATADGSVRFDGDGCSGPTWDAAFFRRVPPPKPSFGVRNCTRGVIHAGDALYVCDDAKALQAVEEANAKVTELERQVIHSRDELSRCQDHLSRVCQNLADEKIVAVSRESGIDNAVNRSLEAMRVIRCNRTEIKALQANIDRLRQQLAEQAPLVAIARELREALAESSMSICRNGDMCDSLMVEAVDADRLLAILEKLRDAKGGAV